MNSEPTRANASVDWPQLVIDGPNKASEAQLRQYSSAGAITSAKVMQTPQGFIVAVTVNWKEGDLTVYSQRNRPRAWASVDRLIGHLARVAPSIQHLEVFLNPEGSSP